MENKLFNRLSIEKRNRIINASILEFSKFGYQNSSTNRIVKYANISKGSLFKYFSTKENLYLYILEYVSKEFIDYVSTNIDNLSDDIFTRIIEYSEIEISWCMINKDKYKLLLNSKIDDGSTIFKRISEYFNKHAFNIFDTLFSNIDEINFSVDFHIAKNIILWSLHGFNNQFIAENHIDKNEKNIDILKGKYLNELSIYINALKKGIYIKK